MFHYSKKSILLLSFAYIQKKIKRNTSCIIHTLNTPITSCVSYLWAVYKRAPTSLFDFFKSNFLIFLLIFSRLVSIYMY